MLVREFMTQELTTLQETDSLLDAAMVFIRTPLRHLPVLRERKLVGMVTEREIKQFASSPMSRNSPEEYNAMMEATPVSRVMTRDPLAVKPDQSMHETAGLMYERKLSALPVVENGELIGIITTTDMLALLVRLMKEKGLAN